MIRHSILYFGVRVGNGVVAIATLAVFTRLLSPEEYGVYALGMAMATVATLQVVFSIPCVIGIVFLAIRVSMLTGSNG